MTQTLFLANCRAILVAIIAYCAGRGWLTPADSGALTAILVPIGALVGPWIWIIYANINAKLVPHDSVAISPEHVMTRANPVGSTAIVGDSGGTVTAKVVGALIAAIALSLLFLPAVANAQSPKRFVPTGDLVKDIQTTATPEKPKLITGDIEKDAHAIWDKIVSASNADLKYASALAGVANTPASMVRKQCYDAILDLNTQVNGMNLKDAQGNQLPQPDPKLFTGVEQAAETIDNLSPSGKLFTSCAGMAQLTKTNVLTLINAIVTGAAGFAAMPVIPGL